MRRPLVPSASGSGDSLGPLDAADERAAGRSGHRASEMVRRTRMRASSTRLRSRDARELGQLGPPAISNSCTRRYTPHPPMFSSACASQKPSSTSSWVADNISLRLLVLTVERHQRLPRSRNSPTVAERTAYIRNACLPSGQTRRASTDLLRIRRNPLRQVARGQREHALDVRLGGADGRSAARLAAEQQVERVGEDRLPGTRLAVRR